MSSLVPKNQGVFDPRRKFAFTNITNEDFHSAWDGSPIVIHPGETVKLDHHLANKFVDEMVDKIMIGEAKLDEVQKNQPYYRSPKGSNLGVPAARKVYEDMIVEELPQEENTAQMQIERLKMREQLQKDLAAQPSSEPPAIPGTIKEFADIDAPKNIEETKDPLPVKRVGRPKKEKPVT